jgi:RNA polymerase sigma-70 factor (ECF subfamily)
VDSKTASFSDLDSQPSASIAGDHMVAMREEHRDLCDEQFVQLVTQHQRPLYLYILSLVPYRTEAEEILQEASLLIWQKRHEFELGTNFRAWAYQFAYHAVLKFRTRKHRYSKLFSDELVENLASESVGRGESAESRQQALEKCMATLHASDQRLVSLRYRDGASVIEVAKNLGRPVNSVYQPLCRIRKALVQCVLQRMASEERT